MVISSNIVEKYFFNHDPGNFPLMDGQNVFGFLFVICREKTVNTTTTKLIIGKGEAIIPSVQNAQKC